MNVTPRRSRQLACVATFLTLTALVSSATHFKTSAASSSTNVRAAALSYAPLNPPPPAVITNSGTANDIIYNLPGGDGDNQAILEDDGVANNGLSQLRSGNGSFVTVVFANPANTLAINASNDGEKITVNKMDGGFVAKINLKGGTANDIFALGNGATLKGGTVDGNGGSDTLDYSAYTTPVSVNLGLNGAAFYQADISSIQETPPNTSAALGSASAFYDNSTHTIQGLGVGVTGITSAQVTGLKLRRGPVNAAGPVVADLISFGSVIPNGNGFQYNGVVVPLPPEQEAAWIGGLLYVEVETTAFPGGEVRGQIIPNGPLNPTVATATGIAVPGVAGISNVIGGSGNDSLVGSPGDNLLRGGPGDDTLYAGPGFGGDRMQGEGGNDTMLFNTGDGSFGLTTIDGGPGSDLVNVNGRQNLDAFSAEPATSSLSGTGRLLFHPSTGSGPNDLDIGTVETLTVSGYNGNDSFTVGSLAGVNDLTTINFNGLIGNDTFNITPSATITFNVNGGDPSPPTFPGDLLNLNTAGATSLALTATNGATGTQGTYTFSNRQPVNFLTLEAVNPTTIRVNDVTVPEGNAGSTGAVFTVSLDAPTNATVTVDYVTFNGTAVSPGDYQGLNGTVTFSPGQTTRFVTVPVNGDTLPEGNETFILNLSNPVGALLVNSQGVCTIVNDDAVTPTPSISINNVAVTEGNSGSSSATFTATLSAVSAQAVSVDASTANGSATAPVDYQTASAVLTFAPGVTTANFNVPINGDTTPEGNETFFVNLTNPVNASLATAQGTGTINDDDSTNIFQFSSPTASVAENAVPGSATVTVTRTGDTSGAASVKFETIDGTAKQKTDYSFGYGTVQFGPGETSKNVQILIVNDTFIEGPETFQVSLSSPSGNSAIGSPGTITVTITDDDLAAATNPIDDAGFFVRQHYLDFLGREADAPGLAFWTSNITSCGANPGCVAAKRVTTSAAFFLSNEFQETGGYALRIQRTAFGKQSNDPFTRYPYLQFMRDSRTIGQGVVVGQPGSDTLLEQNKQAYAEQTVLTSDFTVRFPPAPAAVYVDALFASAGVTPTAAERTAAINSFGAGGTIGRVAALRSVTDSASVRTADFTPSFVLTEYFGYLRRNPTDAPDFNDAGYQFWFNKLNAFNGNYIDSEMVKAFIASSEYRQRFGTP